MEYQRADGVLAQVVDGRAMLIPPAGTEVIVLNATGTAVWVALDVPSDAASLVEVLHTAHPTVDEAALAIDIATFLDELAAAGLITQQ